MKKILDKYLFCLLAVNAEVGEQLITFTLFSLLY